MAAPSHAGVETAPLNRMRTGALTMRKPGRVRDSSPPPPALSPSTAAANALVSRRSMDASLPGLCRPSGWHDSREPDARRVATTVPLCPVRLDRPTAALHAAPLLGLQLGSVRLSALMLLTPPLPPPPCAGEAWMGAGGSHASEPQATLCVIDSIRAGAMTRRVVKVAVVLASND